MLAASENGPRGTRVNVSMAVITPPATDIYLTLTVRPPPLTISYVIYETRYMMSTPFLALSGAGALPSRTVAVLDAIKHAILSGELKPGQALVETDLAEVLGVSKTPVREALKTLAGAGLVTMNPYKGAAVRVVDDEQARHVYDARLL